jgi:hypothetical protein
MRSAHSTLLLPDPPPSRAGEGLHWLLVTAQIPNQSRIPVGAGLPAKRPAHSTLLLPDPPPSRAGEGLHWLFVTAQIPNQSRIPVGAGLPAMRSAHSILILADPPPSLASQLPQFLHSPAIQRRSQIPGTKKGTFVPLRYPASNLSKYPSTAT